MAESTAATADPDLDRVAASRRRLAAAIVVPAVVVLGAGGIAWADLAPAPPVGGAAARYLPTDGSAQLQLDADGGADVVESTRAVGPTLLLELPALAADHVWGQFDDDEVAGLRLWRRTVTPLDGEVPGAVPGATASDTAEPGAAPDAGTPAPAPDGGTPASDSDGTPDAQVSLLARLGPEGVGLLATTGTAGGLSFSPALPVLPADVAPGSHWVGRGEALPQGLASYRVEGSAAAADAVGEGCLAVTLDLELVPRDGDPVAATQTDTWCPGRGVVASRATGPDGALVVDARLEPLPDDAEAPAAIAGLAADLDPAPPAFAWNAAPGWSASELAFRIVDPLYGEGAYPGVADPLAVAAGGTVAVAAGSELLGYRPDPAGPVRAWVARPGGGIVALAAAGDLALATTTERALVAYAPTGARLWRHALPEVAVADPVADGAGAVVVAALDGTVERLDARSGAPRWSTATGAETEASPAVGEGLVILVDRTGTVRALEADSGRARWATSLPAAARVAVGGGRVVVQGDGGDVWALDPADGSVLWQRTQFGVARGLVVAGGVVVAQTDERTGAWSLVDGVPLWEDAASDGLLSDGARVALLGRDALRVVAADGEVLVAAAAPDAGADSRVLVALADRLWVVTDRLVGAEVGP